MHSSYVFMNHVGLHDLIMSILKLAESLRSSLSKNALICFSEMFEALGRLLDGELDSITPVLLKRAADTNVFIAEQGIKAVNSMCTYSGE